MDDVGRRLDPSALRDWTLGEGAAADRLSSTVQRIKSRAADDPELEQLLFFLSQQSGATP